MLLKRILHSASPNFARRLESNSLTLLRASEGFHPAETMESFALMSRRHRRALETKFKILEVFIRSR